MKTLYAHQVEVAQKAVRRNILLADETGAGKTLSAIETANQCLELATGNVLVIVTKKAVPQWIDAIQDQIPNARIVHMSKHFNPVELLHTDTWFIVHYEALVAIWHLVCQHRWVCVLLDEAHRIKTRSTHKKPVLRTQAVKNATQLSLRKVALTGTPWDKDPAELWSILNWLYPKRYTSYWKFREEHTAVETDYLGYEKVIGCRDHKKLAQELAPYTFQRTKHQLRADMPPLTFSVVRVELEQKQQSAFGQLKKAKDLEVLIELEGEEPTELVIKNALTHVVRMQQMSSNPALLGINAPSGKLLWLAEYLEDNPNERVVIFTRFRDTAITIADSFNVDLVVGGMEGTPAARFLSGELRGVVGTIAGMGESLNLQRASTAIFLDQEWSSALMKQAIDRIHRIDITEPKQVIFLQSTSVDALVIDAFSRKWSEHKLVAEFLTLIGEGKL